MNRPSPTVHRHPAALRALAGAACLASLLVFTGGCVNGTANRPVLTPEANVAPTDPLAIANRVMTGMLISSPLNDFNHNVNVGLDTSSDLENPTIRPIRASLERKIGDEPHLLMLPPTAYNQADYLLRFWIRDLRQIPANEKPGEPVDMVMLNTLVIELADRRSGKVVYTYSQPAP